jgi:hypothetical protein
MTGMIDFACMFLVCVGTIRVAFTPESFGVCYVLRVLRFSKLICLWERRVR